MSKTLLFSAFVLMMIVLVPYASAYTYLNIYIDSSGNAEFLGETSETSSTLLLPAGVSILDGKIRGTTSTLTTKNGELWTFSYSLDNAEIRAILPEGSAIENLSGGEISLERNRISVYFQNEISINYQIEELSTSNSTLIISLLVIIVLALALYFFRKNLSSLFKPKVIYKKSKVKEKKTESIKHLLSDRENLILERLSSTGKIKMSQLRKLSEIPKASFSRHIQELEKKKLLIRSGEGKNKFVEVSKK